MLGFVLNVFSDMLIHQSWRQGGARSHAITFLNFLAILSLLSFSRLFLVLCQIIFRTFTFWYQSGPGGTRWSLFSQLWQCCEESTRGEKIPPADIFANDKMKQPSKNNTGKENRTITITIILFIPRKKAWSTLMFSWELVSTIGINPLNSFRFTCI